MITIGAFVRLTQDVPGDEPLVEGMVGKVVPDVYQQADPGSQTLVVIAGARKACTVPLEAVEEISESDYSDDIPESRSLWKERRRIWRTRHGPASGSSQAAAEPPPERSAYLGEGGKRLEVADLVRRAEAVDADELAALASSGLLWLLTEWSVGALDVLADELPRFKRMTYSRARAIRTDHIERWIWDGLRLYLSVRSYHPALPPVQAEPSQERVRALFERIDEGEAADRLASFSLDVASVKETLSLMATHWLNQALSSFAKGLKEKDAAFAELAKYILQLHIVGYQAGFCADSVNHGIPSN